MSTKPLFRSIMLASVTSTVLVISTLVIAATYQSLTTEISDTNLYGKTYVPNEVMVKFKSTVPAQQRAASVAIKRNVVQENMKNRWVRVELDTSQTMETALKAYRGDPAVEYVQPNYIYQATVAPNDPQYLQLWAFRNTGQLINTGTYAPTTGTPGADMNIEPAWAHVTDCSSVVAAVLDTGVNYSQQDLIANMWSGNTNHGWDYIDNDDDPMDLNGHGTHVAGIFGAAGNNSLGAAGACWNASIMAVRVLNVLGTGTTATIIQGIDFAISNGAKIINMSLSGSGAIDPAFSDAITRAQNSDVVVVVAAGNESSNNDTSPRYPCNFTQPNLLCVAALDQNFALASFSNWGATSVDVGAPGTNIRAPWAGTETTITDRFNNGGALNWTTFGGGWDYNTAFSPIDVLANPGNFPSGMYANNADQRVYKNFNLNGQDSAALKFLMGFEVQPADVLNLNFRSAGGDPFSGGVMLVGGSGSAGGFFLPFFFDISPCISATCSVGFQLLTNATGTDLGVGIRDFRIEALALNANSYNTINGTSMATPEVAGAAAMLRAYNPQFNHTDTINALKNGGRSIAALAGKTTTGKAVDVMSSLAYINPPAGLTATVQ